MQYKPSGHGSLPEFITVQVLVKSVNGGTDSPSPIVTSLTNVMEGKGGGMHPVPPGPLPPPFKSK